MNILEYSAPEEGGEGDEIAMSQAEQDASWDRQMAEQRAAQFVDIQSSVPPMLERQYEVPPMLDRNAAPAVSRPIESPTDVVKDGYIPRLQQRVGAKPDGVWGPQSSKALVSHMEEDGWNPTTLTAEKVIDNIVDASVPPMLVKAVSDNSSFKDALGKRESGNDYSAVNQLGYLGKYQFGGMALRDLGYKDKDYNWTGKDGIKSKEDFLANGELQEKSIDRYFTMQERYLKSKGALDYVGTTFKGFKVTKQGLIAAAHLVGAGAVNTMLKTGIVPQDANGTKALEYLKLGNKYSK
jgi:hypothetical protein